MSAVRAGPDAMVTVKVTYDGTNRRVKMPLREMVPNVLEEHVSILYMAVVICWKDALFQHLISPSAPQDTG